MHHTGVHLLRPDNEAYLKWERRLIDLDRLQRPPRQRIEPEAMSYAGNVLEKAVRSLLAERMEGLYESIQERVLAYWKNKNGQIVRSYQELDVVAARLGPGLAERRIWRVFEIKSGYKIRGLRGKQIKRIRRLVRVLANAPEVQRVWVDCSGEPKLPHGVHRTSLDGFLHSSADQVLLLDGEQVWERVKDLGLDDGSLWDRVVEERSLEVREAKRVRQESSRRTTEEEMKVTLADLAGLKTEPEETVRPFLPAKPMKMTPAKVRVLEGMAVRDPIVSDVEDITNYTGTTPSTVSRHLCRLERAGFVYRAYGSFARPSTWRLTLKGKNTLKGRS